MGFTPGPWKIYDKDSSTPHIGTIDTNLQRGYAYEPVCQFYDDISSTYDMFTEYESLANCDANMNLIVRAPELLKALETCVEIIKNEYPEEQWNDYKVDEFEALISKAKGE